MAYVSSDRNSALIAHPLVSRLQAIMADVRSQAELRRTYRSTLNELQGLSTRELADLGLNPSNLRQIAWETAQSVAQDRKPA